MVPDWLEVDAENLKGTVKELPSREAIDVPVDEMPSPSNSIYAVFGSSVSDVFLIANDLRFMTISVTSSLTPGIELNSCSTPSIFTWLTAAPGSDESIILNGGADSKLYMELTITKGRGYSSADKNKKDDSPIAMIPIDSIYTPVERVNLTVENTRVGQITRTNRQL